MERGRSEDCVESTFETGVEIGRKVLHVCLDKTDLSVGVDFALLELS